MDSHQTWFMRGVGVGVGVGVLATLSLTPTLLLGEINVGPTLWKWDPHIKWWDLHWFHPIKDWLLESVEKRVLLALL